MKHKKAFIIGICVCVLLFILGFVYLWSLGVFSGSAGFGPRNQTVEQAVTQELNRRITEAFSGEEGYSLQSVKSFAAIYCSRFPEEKYPAGAAVPEADVDRAIREEHNNITVELTFLGKKLKFQEYKELTYQIMQVLTDRMDWQPLSLQIFYQRLPEGTETDNVLEYESGIPNYLFGKDRNTVVSSSGTHYMVELEESTETKVKAYYTTKYIYLAVLSLTVIALSLLFVVRKVKKHLRNKNRP